MRMFYKNLLRFLSLAILVSGIACSEGKNQGQGDEASRDLETSPPPYTNTIDGASVDEGSVDFRENALNIKQQESIAFLNSSDRDMTLSLRVSNTDQFRLVDNNVELIERSDVLVPSGRSLLIPIRYLRLSSGKHSGKLIIQDADGGIVEVALEGRTHTANGNETFFIIPASFTCGDLDSDGSGKIDKEIRPVEFPNVQAGTSTQVAFKICNKDQDTTILIQDIETASSSALQDLLFHLPISSACADDSSCQLPTAGDTGGSYVDLKLKVAQLAEFVSFTTEDGRPIDAVLPLEILPTSYAKIIAKITPDLSDYLKEGEIAKPLTMEVPIIVTTLTERRTAPLRGKVLSNGPLLLVDGQKIDSNSAIDFGQGILPEDSPSPEVYPEKTLTLQNTGDRTLTLYLSLSGDGFDFVDCPSLPISLTPQQSQTVGMKHIPNGHFETAQLLITSNSTSGANHALPLIASSKKERLVEWRYRSIPLYTVSTKEFLDLAKIKHSTKEEKAVTEKAFTIVNRSQIANNSLFTSLAVTEIGNSAIKLYYKDSQGRQVPLKVGQAASLTVSPGIDKTFSLGFEAPEKGTALGDIISGKIRVQNKLASGAVNNSYTLPFMVEVAEQGSSTGAEPIVDDSNVGVVIKHFGMLVLDDTKIGTLDRFSNNSWLIDQFDLANERIYPAELESTTQTDTAKQLTVTSSKFMGYCIDALARKALENEEVWTEGKKGHYMLNNNDLCFDFIYKGDPYCVDSINFSQDIECVATDCEVLSKSEFTRIRNEMSDQGCETVWKNYDYIPEEARFVVDISPPEGGSYYNFNELTADSQVTIPDVEIHLILPTSAEGHDSGLLQGEPFDQILPITFTTEPINDFGKDETSGYDKIVETVKEQMVAVTTNKTEAEAAQSLIAKEEWAAGTELGPYIKLVNGTLYFSGERVNWGEKSGCLKLVGWSFFPDAIGTPWFMTSKATMIALTLAFVKKEYMDDPTAASDCKP